MGFATTDPRQGIIEHVNPGSTAPLSVSSNLLSTLMAPLKNAEMPNLPDRHIARSGIFILFLLLLAACTSRPGPEVLLPVNASPSSKLVSIYVATTRQPAENGQPGFTSGRSAELRFAKYVIAIPPGHKKAEIEWPGRNTDPEKNFVTVSTTSMTQEAFSKAMAAEPKLNTDNTERMPFVFVHGYNYNFQESLYQTAQMAADGGDISVPVLFAWPSDASVSGYLADRDSATFSRDPLARFLTLMTATGGFDQVFVGAHSMGAFLTTESLLQLRQTGHDDVISHLRVALASPDIDVDVFKSQMRVIGRLDPPMVVMVASDDRALTVSGKIAGNRSRLGAVSVTAPDIRALAVNENLRFIDMSHVTATDRFKHNRFFLLTSVARSEETSKAKPVLAAVAPARASLLNPVLAAQ
jgi:esterase/lipase superfamily enzyme